MKGLWQAAAETRQGYHRWLWMAVLALLYGTGMRRGELSRLDLADWNREEGILNLDGHKTGRERRVSVPDLVYRCVEAYLPQRQNHLEGLGLGQEPAFLINKEGGRLREAAISRAVQSLASRAAAGRITLHQFRHTCASDLLEGGVHVAKVQQVLGHATVATTMRYLHIADPQRHEAVGRHPINRMLEGAGHGRAEEAAGAGGRLPGLLGRRGAEDAADGDRRAMHAGAGLGGAGGPSPGAAALEGVAGGLPGVVGVGA
jgi:site-specific recombinase XerD